jgi:hypothetical protein
MARVTLNEISNQIAELTQSVKALADNQLALAKRMDAYEAKPVSASKAKAVATKKASSTKKAVTTKTAKGKGKATVSEAKKAEHKAATLAYKADKRTRNCLTSKENKLVAKQMREQGLNPADKKAWEKAKAAYIKTNPLA